MDKFGVFEAEHPEKFRRQILNWVQDYEVACILDSNSEFNPSHLYSYADFDFMVAAGVNGEISTRQGKKLSDIDKVYSEKSGWYFGFLSYEMKNYFENLHSDNKDNLNWPDFYFFNPEILFLIKNKKIEIHITGTTHLTPEMVFEQLNACSTSTYALANHVKMKARISREKYLKCVESILKHIARGDLYEVNFCQEFYSYIDFDPYNGYLGLNEISPMPFSCFFKLGTNYLLAASPERFLKKAGNMLISQPIKGTAPRSTDRKSDGILARNLSVSVKERAENIMIVDLIRNDLSRIAKKDSVEVNELCGIYSFKQVHHLISTISCVLNTNSLEEIWKATFPMGSMTGAPKISAMKIAEKYESTRRGLYSGSVGYITPDKNFDFNVVIRSLQYNSKNQYLSYMVGGAITGYSDPVKEYEECLIKAAAIKELLNKKRHA